MGDIVWRLRNRAEKMLADREYAVNPALLKQAADVIEGYQERLEIRYAYRKGPDDEEPVRYEIPEAERDRQPDGIDCRDATISILEGNWKSACDRADTAFLEGVKAGLEAAKDAIHKAESEEPADEIGFGLMEARNLVAALDPTTITRKGGADG